MNSFRRPAFLFLILGFLGAVAYWDEWKVKKESSEEDEKSLLFKLRAKDVIEIIYEKNQGDDKPVRITLQKEGGLWRILSPAIYSADTEVIDRWLGTFKDVRFEKQFSIDPGQLKNFGLEPPQISLNIKLSNGQDYSIEIGSKSPVGYSSYLTIDKGKTVNLVGHQIFVASNKGLHDFRKKTLGLPKTQSVTQFSFRSSKQTAFVLKRIEDNWMFTGSDSRPVVDTDLVDRFLNTLSEQKVESFIDEPSQALLKAFDTKNSATELVADIQLQDKESRKFEASIFSNNGILYGKVSGIPGIVTLGKQVEQVVSKTEKDFYNLKIANFKSEDAVQLKIDSLTYKKTSGQWTVAGSIVDSQGVERFLKELSSQKGRELMSESKQNELLARSPKHEIEVLVNQASIPIHVTVWENLSDKKTIMIRSDTNLLIEGSSALLLTMSDLHRSPEAKLKSGASDRTL